jgi:hypothetical protein
LYQSAFKVTGIDDESQGDQRVVSVLRTLFKFLDRRNSVWKDKRVTERGIFTMKLMRLVTPVLCLSLVCGTVAWAQPGSSTNSQDTVITKKTKKKKKHNHGHPSMAHHQAVPAGVATRLPAKRYATNGSYHPNQDRSAASAVALTDPAVGGESRFGTNEVFPSMQLPGRFHATIDAFSDSIDKDDFHIGNNKVWALSLKPLLIMDLANDFSGYLTDEFTNFSPSGVSDFSIINRPELGAVKDLYQDDDMIVSAGVSVKLPIFDAGGSDLFIEPMRVWQIGLGATSDYLIPDTSTHLIGALKMTYDTKASFSHLTSDLETGAPINSTGYQRPITLLSTLGATHEEGHFTIGLAFHTTNQLASATILTDGGVLRDVSPVSLLRGEVFAAYHFEPGTFVNGSLSRGLRTSNDVASYAAYNFTQDVAQTSLMLGVTQAF